MRLYLDDNLAGHVLVGLLKRAGHTAVRPVDAGLGRATDPRHLLYAAQKDSLSSRVITAISAISPTSL